MAMAAMEIRSSAIASVEKNTRTPLGTRLPKSDSTPSAKAISVAMGMAQPLRAPAWLKMR